MANDHLPTLRGHMGETWWRRREEEILTKDIFWEPPGSLLPTERKLDVEHIHLLCEERWIKSRLVGAQRFRSTAIVWCEPKLRGCGDNKQFVNNNKQFVRRDTERVDKK